MLIATEEKDLGIETKGMPFNATQALLPETMDQCIIFRRTNNIDKRLKVSDGQKVFPGQGHSGV